MKNLFFTLMCFVIITASAQVGIGTTTPNASSILELDSTTQGMLTPRMTESERDLIASPATGLLIYQTNNTPGFYYYNSTAWVPFGGGGAEDHDWYQITSDDTPDHINDDIYTHGNVAVGNIAPTAKLHITGTTTPGNLGGTVELLNEDFTGYTVVENNSNSGCTVDGWENTTTGDALANCSSCTGNWLYIDSDELGCTQNSTNIVTISTNPTSTNISVSFDYRYNDYGASDTFRVYLFNESTGLQEGADLVNINTDVDASYSSSLTVSPNTPYSIRFYYTGNYSYGASIDNILVTETSVASPGSYVFRLEDGQEQAGYVLTSDANGNATWQAASGGGTDSQLLSISGDQLTISNGNTVTIPTGGGGGNSANNGLSISGSNVQLGGDLIKNTTINLDSYDLTFQTNPLSVFPGDIIFSGANRTVMETNLEDDYVNFGGGFPSVDSDDGVGFTDSGGDAYTRDFVWGAYKGSSGGTAIAMGSIEYFVDGLNELLFEGSGIHPLSDETSQFGNTLGASSRRWGAVYATNGVITTSDIRYKKNIKPLQYGLNEIMKLETISYNWRDNTVGKTTIPDNLTKKKIGFSAQQLLEVLPEVVQTHSWTTSDEEGNYKRIKNEKLGVYYSDVIPVAVKAIQEQQEQIQTLKSEVSELKELVNRLISEKN